MGKIENVTERQLREICKKCIENSSGLLEAAELLLPNNNTLQYALGLYMYAIEEYGKAVLQVQKMYPLYLAGYSAGGTALRQEKLPMKRNSRKGLEICLLYA
jgi:AbiV family abortive infection protein